ncbi:MAG: MFS transporter [Eubacterium sp.]|nr:MFS transporter [Candidatus Colimonas fimequi]
MGSLLIAVIYLIFISLGLPDSLLGSGWPQMQLTFGIPSSYAGYVAMTISLMTIVSALASPKLITKLHTKWIVIISIALTICGLMGFSISGSYYMLFLFAIPYGLGAGSIDASVNHYVASNYSSSVMNFLHCFYGVGAVISPNIMALALMHAHWNEGYRWTAYIQIGILLVCILALPLWKRNENEQAAQQTQNSSLIDALKIPGVVLTLIAFCAYCGSEVTCGLWTSSYFAGTKEAISDELVAAFGSLIFGGLMLGRLISGFISERFGDRNMIRMGVVVELIGLLLIVLPTEGYIIAAIGFAVLGTGMGPIYPAITHMAPANFGVANSSAVIGLQMAAAYVGSTFMPMLFGNLQQIIGIGCLPGVILMVTIINIVFLEMTYRKIRF